MAQLLRRASDLARADYPEGRALRGASLIAADWRGRICAEPTCAEPSCWVPTCGAPGSTCADLTGADLRGADLRGADLRGALFVHQSQLESARGDTATQLPSGLARPRHGT